MKIQAMDHGDVIVSNLAAARAFFLNMGFEVLGAWAVEGGR